MKDRAKILAVRARNVKCIGEIEIDDVGDIHEIRGDSGQGKSAILTAIEGGIRGLDPSLIRHGQTSAEIELRLSTATINRVIARDGSPDTLMVKDSDGKPVKQAKDFLKALYDDSAFNPIAWVRLGAGDAKGRTERLRTQRDMLLQAIPMALTEAQVRTEVHKLGDAYLEALDSVNLSSVDYDQHPFVACEALREACYDHRKGLNALAEDAEAALTYTPQPGRKPPEADLAACKKVESEAVEAYHAVKAGQAGRQSLIARRDSLAERVKQAAVSLPPKDVVTEAVYKHEKTVHETEAEVARLEAALAEARGKLEDVHTLLAECQQQQRAWEAHEAHKAALAEIDAELAKSGPVADLAALQQAMENARANTEARRLQDLHEAAAAKAVAAREKADLFDKLVVLFRDTMPKKLLTAARLPVDGLTIDESQILVHGVPLANLGTSEQIRIGVMVANLRNPYAGWLPVDQAESLGRRDRLALRDAARELGLQLIMTFVDPDAAPAHGVTVMQGGAALRAS